ncbi:hypothetical protein GBAR_LOCUS12399 [Geodia barretti]|uniref:Uncharacterized protein n=1 Tax=Geodia barretti TaxID=519541 RepID=A0AA35RZS2_GEOBA|nr:hypothetical protein GBAR_LOCUS12399 [Geodia barretti]
MWCKVASTARRFSSFYALRAVSCGGHCAHTATLELSRYWRRHISASMSGEEAESGDGKSQTPETPPGFLQVHGGTCKDTLSQRGGGLLQSRTRGQQRPKYIGDKRLYEESVGAQQKEKKENIVKQRKRPDWQQEQNRMGRRRRREGERRSGRDRRKRWRK